MAGDLRTLAAVLEIVTELERIGDYGKGIARISLLMGSGPLLKPLVDIPRMEQKAVDMLRRALDAFIRRDVALARAIPLEDAEVDALYNQIYRELLTYHDGRPADHRPRHASAVGGPQPGAGRRPGDQHLRARRLHRDGRDE